MMDNSGSQPSDIRTAVEAHAIAHARGAADPIQAFYDEYDATVGGLAGSVFGLGISISALSSSVATLQSQVPLTGRVANDFVKNADTTLANVTNLKFAAVANQTYSFTFSVLYNSGATPDFKFRVNTPGGAGGQMSYNYLFFGSPVWSVQSFNTDLGADGTGANQLLTIHGLIINGATPGDVQFLAAQTTSDASNTIVRAGSSVFAVPIA